MQPGEMSIFSLIKSFEYKIKIYISDLALLETRQKMDFSLILHPYTLFDLMTGINMQII